jgi:endonuclease/exonuclease/phosphatase family metal-dependent hydrolase
MRVVAWNCCMALHAKLARLAPLRASLLVVPECAGPDVASLSPLYASTTHGWVGSSRHKGLGVFASPPYRLDVIDGVRPRGAYAIVARVHGPRSSAFQLVAIWTQLAQGRRYTANALRIVESLAPFIRAAPTVVAGDFNTCASIRGRVVPGFARLVELLADLGVESAYHAFTGEAYGAESRATYFHLRDEREPYHIDFVFVPRGWRRRIRRVEVGAFAQWRDASDHCPVFVDVRP